MKYVNSLKYMNSFPSANGEGISLSRTAELCGLLGRVNLGTNSIFVPGGASGHATAVMLESVIKAAGYRVGRISTAEGFDSRSIVSLDGKIASIDDYNRGVAELKSTVLKTESAEYKSEEVCFALALLLCKLHDANYVILEGMSETGCDLSGLCSPYDIVVAPPIVADQDDTVKVVCDAIKHGVREVVSGNQKKQIYDSISNACVSTGVRMTVTTKQSFKIESGSSIKLSFSYGERTGYSVRTPSFIQRECAMLVIESALAIRRSGVKLPWAAISTGLAGATGTGCFETFSASPIAVIDTAQTQYEAEQMVLTFNEVFGKEKGTEISVCIPESAKELVKLLDGRNVKKYVVLSMSESITADEDTVICDTVKKCADEVFAMMRRGEDVLCFGSLGFALALRGELVKK